MRELNWNGYCNVRDLGGLPTPLSATGSTRTGRIARGPRRELLDADGWNAARRWGLSTVVDLRCEHEIGALEGDPVLGSDPLEGLTVINAPTEDQDDPEFRRVCFPILDSPEYWPHNWRLLPQLVREALRTVANARPGVLVHCSAGRDRTGMITALLLGNAGVAPEHVAEDYALSVRAMAGAATHTPTQDRQASWTPVQTEAWIAETTPIVREAAADTDAALERIGITPGERDRLRAMLLEP